MSKIKICGLTRSCDIEWANKYKPDYIGFVFAKSKRQVSPETARILKQSLSENIKAVGVFVNSDARFISDLCLNGIIDVIQLHGDEDEAYINELKKLTNKPIIKAVRVKSSEQVLSAEKLNCDMLLCDAYNKNNYGGSGITFNWDLIPKLQKPMFLAGGLDCNNITEAINKVNPYCVDLSSGIETNGLKDEEKIKKIINLVRSEK